MAAGPENFWDSFGEFTQLWEEGGGSKALRRRQGKLAYRASLPSDADPDKIDAQLPDGVLDGVLMVRLPRAAQPRIEIRG